MATATVVPGSIVLEVLNQDNYEQWRSRVKTYLLAKDLWDIVKAPTQQFRDGVRDKVWTKKNAEALYAIQNSCGTDIFTFIKDSKMAEDAWHTLENKFCSELKILETTGSENKDQHEIDDDFEKFLKDVKSDDWGKAREFLAQQPDAVRARSSLNGTTALHVAISAGHLHIVEELLQLMTEEDLEITDDYGVSTFGCAVLTGTIQMVRCLVEKNKQIVSKRLTSPRDMNMTPVLVAYKAGNFQMARYLCRVTPVEFLIQENDGRCDGAELISRCFLTHEFDIGWHLIQNHKILAITKDYSGCYPFNALANARCVFPSGDLEKLNFWQRWIYDSIYKHYTPTTSDICCVDIFEKQEDDEGNLTEHILSVIRGFFQAPVANLLQRLGIKRIYDMKLVHIHTRKFLQCMCEAVKNKQLVQVPCLREAIFKAVERGHVEFIDLLGEANPDLLRVTNGKGRNILQHAIESRQAKVYDSIYKHDNERKATVNSTDTFNNGILHAAGNLYPHLDHIKGAPLQMQRELQWFEEVESITPANVRELTNYTDDMTAQELFSKNHKELAKKGEKSLKAIATSCTVAGTLIVTMMFAASFTVPGGIRGDTGLPMFLKKPLFTFFMISDSISLSASTTSVMIFLGILTSRYKQGDFLISLPTKLILGLCTLFISIVTMMFAFSSALFIMLHRESWIFIPIISLASVVPIFSFVRMQFPLLGKLIASTYGRGMFEKKIKH